MPSKRAADDAFVPEDADEDWQDELTDDSEDEDVKPGSASTSILKGALLAPRHLMLSTKSIHDMIHIGSVELNPAFQRDVVWSTVKMMGLIQSIFLNYYVPPIILNAAQSEDPNGDSQDFFICIDGKQRCTSIQHFIDGLIPFVAPKTKERFWYHKYGDKKHGKPLPDALRRRFDMVQIGVVEYRDLTQEQMRDIFQRVQMGMPLTTAEKMQAIASPWSTWIIELQKKYITEEGTLGPKIQMDNSRGRAFQALGAFVILAFGYPDKRTTVSYQSQTAFLNRADQPDRAFKKKIEMTLGLFVDIATNHFASAFGVVSHRVAPVEFWFTGLIIFSRMGIMSIPTLAKNIGDMRVWIRSIHRDIRTNTATVKDLFSFLHDQVPKKKAPHEIPAASDYEGSEVDPRDVRAAKRLRAAEESDPTYKGPGIAKGNESALSGTRATMAAPPLAPANTSTAPRISRPSFPAAAPARPPQSSMDRAAPPHMASGFGQVQPQNIPQNPYSMPSNNFVTPNGQSIPLNLNWNPQHISHFSNMTSQNPNQPRWAPK